MSDATANPIPVSLRTPEERFAHVSQRMRERGGIDWDVARVAALEAKIKFVRGRMNEQKPVPTVLPNLIGEDKDGHVQYWRVPIAGQPHTFAWSQNCRGLVSYRGPGELTAPHRPLPAQDPKAGIVHGVSTFRDLSGCDPT